MTKRLSDSKVSSMLIGTGLQPPSNMTTFFAIPGTSGKVRLKLEMSENADSVMIRYKTSAWASGDGIETGTLVATLTDNYNLANEWYEVSGLTNGTAYYFKAFPYNGASYNTTIGENETVCKAGGLLNEYTFDSISGSTVNNTGSSSDNGTASNISYTTGTVGNKAVSPSNGNISFTQDAYQSVRSVSCIMTFGASATGDTTFFQIGRYSSTPCITCRMGGGGIAFTMMQSSSDSQAPKRWEIAFSSLANKTIHFVCNMSTLTEKADDWTIYIDGEEYSASYVSSAGTPSLPTSGVSFIGKDSWGNGSPGFSIDQFRTYARELTESEIENIYNGGDGC